MLLALLVAEFCARAVLLGERASLRYDGLAHASANSFEDFGLNIAVSSRGYYQALVALSGRHRPGRLINGPDSAI